MIHVGSSLFLAISPSELLEPTFFVIRLVALGSPIREVTPWMESQDFKVSPRVGWPHREMGPGGDRNQGSSGKRRATARFPPYHRFKAEDRARDRARLAPSGLFASPPGPPLDRIPPPRLSGAEFTESADLPGSACWP